eukprot:CAMPEP_0114632354 /NCGR_PEP_ID=MMETSP0168-20121206/14892_1 /TAXON_ID=95228 ORGANISM="Vannella sp., Strain DIVA3 517/6/12" /NCGR_SAMPLE_ID=MMETSP0168 /ASSEMBLY_ACC=CAM_ASM_000044 /LENGTH=621 /DNA_ID=CAMNT_0001843963 /DNA_START=153 /DNA_END=2016 /DNA_ORIENTATION=-
MSMQRQEGAGEHSSLSLCPSVPGLGQQLQERKGISCEAEVDIPHQEHRRRALPAPFFSSPLLRRKPLLHLLLTHKRKLSPACSAAASVSAIPEANSGGEAVVYHLMAATENEMWFWIAGLQHVKLQGSRQKLQVTRFQGTAKTEEKSVASVKKEAAKTEVESRSPRTPSSKFSRMGSRRILPAIQRDPTLENVFAVFEEDDEELDDLTFEDLSIATTASYMKLQETQRVAVEALDAGQELDEDQDMACLVALEDALVQGHKELVVARREVKQKDQEIQILHRHLQGYYLELKSTVAKLEEEKQKRRELAIVGGAGGIYVSSDSGEEEEGELERWIDDYDMEKTELVEANNLLRQELRDIKTQLLKENTERMRLMKENKDLRAALVYGEQHNSDDDDTPGGPAAPKRSLVHSSAGSKARSPAVPSAVKSMSAFSGPGGRTAKNAAVRRAADVRSLASSGAVPRTEKKSEIKRTHASYSNLTQFNRWETTSEDEADDFLASLGTSSNREALRRTTGGLSTVPQSSVTTSQSEPTVGGAPGQNGSRKEKGKPNGKVAGTVRESEECAPRKSHSEQLPPAFWVPDEDATECETCGATFGLITSDTTAEFADASFAPSAAALGSAA